LVNANPFADLPVSKGIAKRERVEIGEIWPAAGDAAAPYGAIVRLLILTGQRRGEAAGMTWAEISEDLSTWTMPGQRRKNGIPHLVPLNGPARGNRAGHVRNGTSHPPMSCRR
jgi:integrase